MVHSHGFRGNASVLRNGSRGAALPFGGRQARQCQEDKKKQAGNGRLEGFVYVFFSKMSPKILSSQRAVPLRMPQTPAPRHPRGARQSNTESLDALPGPPRRWPTRV